MIRGHATIDLQHACVGCAVREDIPDDSGLRAGARVETIVACLPVSAEADHLRHDRARPQVSRYVRLASVISTAGEAR